MILHCKKLADGSKREVISVTLKHIIVGDELFAYVKFIFFCVTDSLDDLQDLVQDIFHAIPNK